MQVVQLSPFDHMARYNYIRYILCFACNDDERETRKECWASVLSNFVRMYPFLAGKVTDVSNNRIPELHMMPAVPAAFDVVAQGLLRFAERDLCYSDLRDAHFAPSLLRAEQLHWLPLAPPPGEQQAFAVQATFVRGGLIMALWWHHALIDGIGACSILQGLGYLVREMSSGAQLVVEPQLSSIGRKDFHEPDPLITVTPADIEEMLVRRVSPSTHADMPVAHSKTKPPPDNAVSRVFGFNITDLQRIQRSNSRMSSPFRCAVALLLVAILRVRSRLCHNAGKEQRSCRLFIIVDARSALKAPPNFLGNSIHGKFLEWDALDDLQTSQDLVELPACLTLALDRVCATIDAVRQPSFMAKRLAFMQSYDCPGSQAQFELNLRVDDFHLICNSWEEVGKVCSNVDFEAVGLGALDYVRRPYAANSGAIVILPRLADSSLIEVDVGLPERQMQSLLAELDGWRQRNWLKQVLE